jgi:hypothetical protein
MGELEPRDSRIITGNPSRTPIEPERTGPREGETRAKGGGTGEDDAVPAAGERTGKAREPGGGAGEGSDEAERRRWQAPRR